MAHYFGVAAHAHCSAAKLIFDAAIDALDRGALIVADLLSGSVAEPLAAFFLGFELLLSAGPRSRVDIDNGNVAERATVLSDLRGVVSAVHDIIQISRPGRRHAGQWDRRLAIVKRGGGEQAADRNTTVGNVEVQLVADPALLLAPRFREGRLLALRLVPTAQCPGNPANIASRLMPSCCASRRGSFCGRCSPPAFARAGSCAGDLACISASPARPASPVSPAPRSLCCRARYVQPADPCGSARSALRAPLSAAHWRRIRHRRARTSPHSGSRSPAPSRTAAARSCLPSPARSASLSS